MAKNACHIHLHRHGFEKGVVDAFVPAHPGPVALVHTHTRTHVLFLLTSLILKRQHSLCSFHCLRFFRVPCDGKIEPCSCWFQVGDVTAVSAPHSGKLCAHILGTRRSYSAQTRHDLAGWGFGRWKCRNTNSSTCGMLSEVGDVYASTECLIIAHFRYLRARRALWVFFHFELWWWPLLFIHAALSSNSFVMICGSGSLDNVWSCCESTVFWSSKTVLQQFPRLEQVIIIWTGVEVPVDCQADNRNVSPLDSVAKLQSWFRSVFIFLLMD